MQHPDKAGGEDKNTKKGENERNEERARKSAFAEVTANDLTWEER